MALSCTIFLKVLILTLFQSHWATLYCDTNSTLVSLPHSFICPHQTVQNCSSACSPCTSNCTHYTDIQGAPLVARRSSNLHASVSTLSISCTPVCLSGLVQLYSASRSLHPSGGTCPQPLPSCMCTGGVVPVSYTHLRAHETILNLV